MNVLLLTDLFYPSVGGLQTHVYILAKSLVERGVKVTVLTSRIPNSEDIEFREGIKILRIGKFSDKSQIKNYVLKIRDLIRTEKIDLIHAHHYPTVLPLVALRKELNIPFLFTTHACFGDNTLDEKYTFLEKYLIKQGIEVFDKIIAVSKYVQEYLLENGVPFDKISLIHGSANQDIFYNIEIKKNIDLLVPNCFDPWKGAILALELSKLLDKSCKISFLGSVRIFGERGKIYNLIKSAQEKNKNIFIIEEVNQEEMPKIYSSSKLTLVPSENEAFGLVSLESQLCETPVIVSDVGGLGETIIPGETGYFINKTNLNDTVQKINNLLKDKKERERLGKNGRKFIFQNFSKEERIKKVLALYSEVIQKYEHTQHRGTS